MRVTLALLTVCLLAVGATVAVVFQDNITRFNLKPHTPYQIAAPPPPPAYGARGAWVLWPDAPQAWDADVFYIHSTTYLSRRQWNAPIADKKADALLRNVAAPNEAGPFMRVGAVYGPRYRQATLYASFTHKYDGLAARELAFSDIEDAFRYFLDIRDPARPIILVGYGQGGLHVLGLLQHYFADDEDLRRRLVAAYIIDEPTPLRLFDDSLATIPPCETPVSVRCVVSYIAIGPDFQDERKRVQKRALVWKRNHELVSLSEPSLLCVNPISGSRTDARIAAEEQLGAASATGLRLAETPPAVAKATSAQCVDGVLDVDRPKQNFLRRRHWFGEQWGPQNFNLFYHDLSADASRREHVLEDVLEVEARQLKPIEGAVDLEVSPVNKVPE